MADAVHRVQGDKASDIARKGPRQHVPMLSRS